MNLNLAPGYIWTQVKIYLTLLPPFQYKMAITIAWSQTSQSLANYIEKGVDVSNHKTKNLEIP
jgi:hypothetical protein